MALTTATDAEVDIASIWQQYKAVPDPLSEQERRQMRNFLVERFLPLVKYNGERIWSRLPEGVELSNTVREAVDGLPHHLREILLLSYFQKMSYNQIAETLQIPLGTVKSRLHAAVAAFADAWRRHSDLHPGETS